MDSDNLYRVQKEDLPKLEKLLSKCFALDPLYQELIPDEEIRKRLMPELFSCDLTEFYETCEIFADSSEINGILVVSDESEPYNLLKYYFTEVQAALRTEGYLIKEDHSLKTFFNFFLESGLSRGDYPNYIFFECVNYPLSICSDGRQ